MSERRYCPACKRTLRDRNADACPDCGGRAEDPGLTKQEAEAARSRTLLASGPTIDGVPVFDDEQVEACRAKIDQVLKHSPKWPMTNWFNDAEFDRCLATVEKYDEQIDRLAKFIVAEVPGEPSESEGACDTAIRIIKNLKEKLGMGQFLTLNAEELAKSFHAIYEELTPAFGYKTKALMIATCERVFFRYGITHVQPMTKDPASQTTPPPVRDPNAETRKAEKPGKTSEAELRVTASGNGTAWRLWLLDGPFGESNGLRVGQEWFNFSAAVQEAVYWAGVLDLPITFDEDMEEKGKTCMAAWRS